MNTIQQPPNKILLAWAVVGLIIIGLAYTFCPDEPMTATQLEYSVHDN